MALKAPFNFRGLIIPEAYIRVGHVWGGKFEGWSFQLQVFATQAEAEMPKAEPVTVMNIAPPAPYDSTKDAVRSCYEAVTKKGAVFEGAVNV